MNTEMLRPQQSGMRLLNYDELMSLNHEWTLAEKLVFNTLFKRWLKKLRADKKSGLGKAHWENEMVERGREAQNKSRKGVVPLNKEDYKVMRRLQNTVVKTGTEDQQLEGLERRYELVGGGAE